ncbi:hypothetical protein L1887_07712 [Cichorium endivia]|nr:hypothetical protein L1887_07712 [Cichorium endivia]
MAETALVPSYVKPGCTEMCAASLKKKKETLIYLADVKLLKNVDIAWILGGPADTMDHVVVSGTSFVIVSSMMVETNHHHPELFF